jgi:hypothetical protein
VSSSWEELIKQKANSAPEFADAEKRAQQRRQRALLEKIIGKRVVDVAIVNDRNGDDAFLTFYAAKAQPIEEEICIAQVWLVEQTRQFVRFEAVIHRQGAYFLPDGVTVLAEAIRDGHYNING